VGGSSIPAGPTSDVKEFPDFGGDITDAAAEFAVDVVDYIVGVPMYILSFLEKLGPVPRDIFFEVPKFAVAKTLASDLCPGNAG